MFDSSTTGQRKGRSTGSPNDHKKKNKEEEKKRLELLLSLWVCGKVNTCPRYIHNIDADVEINVFSERECLQTQAKRQIVSLSQ